MKTFKTTILDLTMRLLVGAGIGVAVGYASGLVIMGVAAAMLVAICLPA